MHIATLTSFFDEINAIRFEMEKQAGPAERALMAKQQQEAEAQAIQQRARMGKAHGFAQTPEGAINQVEGQAAQLQSATPARNPDLPYPARHSMTGTEPGRVPAAAPAPARRDTAIISPTEARTPGTQVGVPPPSPEMAARMKAQARTKGMATEGTYTGPNSNPLNTPGMPGTEQTRIGSSGPATTVGGEPTNIRPAPAKTTVNAPPARVAPAAGATQVQNMAPAVANTQLSQAPAAAAPAKRMATAHEMPTRVGGHPTAPVGPSSVHVDPNHLGLGAATTHVPQAAGAAAKNESNVINLFRKPGAGGGMSTLGKVGLGATAALGTAAVGAHMLAKRRRAQQMQAQPMRPPAMMA